MSENSISPSRAHIEKVVAEEFVVMEIATLVHRSDIGKSIDGLISSTYNGILDPPEGRPLSQAEIREVTAHELDATKFGEPSGGYIDWDAYPEKSPPPTAQVPWSQEKMDAWKAVKKQGYALAKAFDKEERLTSGELPSDDPIAAQRTQRKVLAEETMDLSACFARFFMMDEQP